MRLKKIQITALLLSLSALLALDGCRSKKETLEAAGNLEKKTAQSLIENVVDNNVKYQTIECKGKIEIKKGTAGQKTNAVFKLMKDSLIQASIRMPLLGSEFIRINLTPSRITIIDRLQQKYAIAEYGDIKAGGLSGNGLFYNLQALLTNQLFVPGQISFANNDLNTFKMSSTPKAYMLQTQAGERDLTSTFAIDATDRIVSVLLLDKETDMAVQWSYKDFIIDKNNLAIYPTLMETKAEIGKMRFDMNIECPQLEIDSKNFKPDMAIPSRYEQVDIANIIQSYMNKLQ